MKRVLIVGATSSIAADVARIYASRGDQLVLLARDKKKLDLLSNELGSSAVASRCADFDKYDENEAVLRDCFAQVTSFDLVLIAHGYLGDQLRSEREYAEAAQINATNYLSVVSQLIVLGTYMEQQGHGQIAVLCSVAGDRGRPRNYTYGAAKAAVKIYLQGLRSRLWPHVSVTTILLGPVDTPMTAQHTKSPAFVSSVSAARGVVSAIDRKKKEAYVPGRWALIMWLVRTMPEFIFQRLRFLSGRD